MPQALVIPLITALASTGVGFGLEQLTKPKTPSGPDLNAEMQQQAAADAKKQAEQEAATKAQMLRKSAPDAQAAVGGSLTDAPFAQLTADIAGQPGGSIQEIMKLLGQGGGSETSGLSFSGGA